MKELSSSKVQADVWNVAFDELTRGRCCRTSASLSAACGRIVAFDEEEEMRCTAFDLAARVAVRCKLMETGSYSRIGGKNCVRRKPPSSFEREDSIDTFSMPDTRRE